MEYIAIKCSNFYRSNVLLLKVKTVKEMSTKILVNTKLHHMGLSWITSSSKQMKYSIKENNHAHWLEKCSRYNTAICWA